jgi:hypothetical protein
MNHRDEHDDLWHLLGKARQTKVSPFFARNVAREVRAQKPGERSFFALLQRRWQLALASAAVTSVIAAAGWQYWQADFSRGSSDQLTVIARQVSDSPVYDVISDLDELIASEETSVWLEGPIY